MREERAANAGDKRSEGKQLFQLDQRSYLSWDGTAFKPREGVRDQHSMNKKKCRRIIFDQHADHKK